MVFSSLSFLCIFLPIVYLLHLFIPDIRIKNILLLIASIIFYAYGEPVYVLLLLGSGLMNFCFALLIDRAREGKALLVLAVAANIGLLIIFKYTGFILGLVNHIPGIELAVPSIPLPIGISFFTFQALSYVIDVYRGKTRANANPLEVMLYISLFPQLIAGPIVRYTDIEKELHDRTCTIDGTASGMCRFSFGLAKKVLLSNVLGSITDTLFALPLGEVNILAAWLGAISYMLQIYFDFSGYSDMAIGLGEMFGFHFKENFLLPYTALGIQDFWRRWHISLSTWFREYVYIPLGGNRKGSTDQEKKRNAMINRFIVFVLTGIWHGANLTFLVWGIWHGLFLTLEEALNLREKIPSMAWIKKLFIRIYTLLAVCLGFVIFRADNLYIAWNWIKTMFTGFSINALSLSHVQGLMTPKAIIILTISCIFAATPAPKKRSYIISLVLLILCMLALAGNTYNPFIYFQF